MTENPRPARPAATVIGVGDRAAAAAAVLGSRAELARVLSVPESRLRRWITGQATPSPEQARIIVDLDYVIALAGLLWAPPVIYSWLVGRNAFLGGARPLDVLRMRGYAAVIDALDQELAGSYA
jgi:type II secretory pathway component PulL